MTQTYYEQLEAGEKPKETQGWPCWRIFLPLLGCPLCLLLFLTFRQNDVAASPGALNYLYITFHGDGSATTPLPEYGINQILRFNLENLTEPSSAVLDLTGSPTPPRMLRDMEKLKDGTLFVAQGLKFDSCILQYGPCDAKGLRPFQKEYRSPILVHPYALTLLGDTLFASTQDSGTVVGFNLTGADDLSNGNRINFNLQGAFRYRPGITYRGITNYQKCLYLAVTEMDVVAVICDFDSVSRRIPVRHPIGLMVDEEKKELYIASPMHGHKSHEDQQGEVLVFDLSNDKLLRRLRHEGMEHPTNMVLRKDKVIVASQTQKSILEFKRSSGEFSKVLIQDLPDAPENIMLSPC